MTLSPLFLDELRARTTLSALIAPTVKLTKAGREYKACCPVYNEKTPSFYVNDEKGSYHCLVRRAWRCDPFAHRRATVVN